MSAENLYYKVKPKESVKVKAIASIELPFYDDNSIGEYYAANSIPSNGEPRNLYKNNTLYSEGSPESSDTSKWMDPESNFGFRTPEEQYLYRYGSDFEGKKISGDGGGTYGKNNNVSFQTIYCKWDKYKFANFVIESLVGKALTQAIAYNYFGYPISNVSRRIDLNYDNEDNTSWYFGRMPNLGSNDPVEPVPIEDQNMNASGISGFLTLTENGADINPSAAGINPITIANDITLLSEDTNDDLYSRYYKMLGAYRKSSTVFVKADEFVKFYTNSHIFEIRDYPINQAYAFGSPPGTSTSVAEDRDSGAKENNILAGAHEDYESGRAPDENWRYLKKLENDGKLSDVAFGADLNDSTTLKVIQDKGSEKYRNIYQPVHKTQARLWYPSFQTSLPTSPLYVTMGSSDGIKRTDWYFDSVALTHDNKTIEGENPTTLTPDDLFAANFKTSNLVSMFKLVPAGIPQEERDKFLENPHFTLNHITPKMLEYVAKIVPQNPRFAGPKPASVEPYSKTFKPVVSWIESAIIAESDGVDNDVDESVLEEDSYYKGCTPIQVQRVISGSFFEFQVGRKYANAPYLARDPREEVVQNGDLVNNTNYEKLGTQEKVLDGGENSKYSVGYFSSTNKKPTQENIDYAAKFGLWNNDWIGGYSAKYYYKDGTPQNSPYTNSKVTSYARPGGFMVLPRNTRTIKSMLNSLPTQNLYGLEVVANAIENGANSFELTKLVSDLWLSYHFATKPNGMGFSSDVSLQYTDAIKNTVPEWTPWVNVDFTLNTLYDEKVKQGSQIQYYKTPALTDPANYFTDFSLFNDVSPLLYKVNKYDYKFNQQQYAGYPFVPTDITNPGFNGFLDDDSIQNERGSNVPVRIRRASQLEFPIWNWKRGGGEGWADLDSINWPSLIEDPADTNSPYATTAFNTWKKYVEQSPGLVGQARECVPKWVKSLRIYPTVKDDAIQNGFIPNTLPITKQAIVLKSSWNLDDGNAIAQNEQGDEYYQDFFWSFEDQFSNNTLQNMDLAAKQKQYVNSEFNSDIKYIESYKTGDKLENTCHPWMTLNFEIDNNINSQTYRQAVDSINVDLTYAVELEIDEVKLVADLVKMGVVGLAGTSEEYADIGLDLVEIFESAQGNSSLYSQSLLDGYAAYNASTNPNGGAAVDFGSFPSVIPGANVPFQAQQEALEAQPVINQKIEDAKKKYPSTNNPVNSYIWLKDSSKKTAVYSKPSAQSRILGYIENFTTIRVLKEWSDGIGNFNTIKVLDESAGQMNEVVGFVSPNHIEPAIEDYFFSTGIAGGKGIFDKGLPKLKLKSTLIKDMSEMARAVVPTWWKQTEPYYYTQEGEYWHTVELKGEDCVVDDNDLEQKKAIAMQIGLRQLFDFYGKKYSDSTIDKFANSYLAARIDDYQLDMRPGSSIKFLLKVGGVYINAIPNTKRNLKNLKKSVPYKIGLNQQFYERHVVQALFGLNRIYLDIATSEYTLRGINFVREIERLEQVPIALKRMLAVNGIDVATNEENTIELGYDYNFKLIYVSYIERGSGKEKILDVGYEYFTNLSPINNPNTMSLFYHHRELRNPLLKWRDAIEKYFVNPKPQIIKKSTPDKAYPSNNVCGPLTYNLPGWRDILGPIAANLDSQLQLDPRFDLGSFQFSLYKYLPPCPKPPSGVGDTLLYGEYEINAERDFFTNAEALTAISAAFDLKNAKEYVGDWFSSADAIDDIKARIFDLEDVEEYLSGLFGSNMSEIITNIYSRICKCFLDVAGIDTVTLPNLELDANAGSIGANLQPSNILDPNTEIGNIQNPSVSGTNPFSDPGKDFDAENLFCSFCIEIPSFFLRLPTTNIMDVLVVALKKLLELLLAQLILALIQALLDILLTCPELTCPEGERNVRDYGGNNLADVFNEEPSGNFSGTGKPIPAFFEGCGIIIDGQQLTSEQMLEFMYNISQRLTSGECLSLVTGGINTQMMEVAKEEIAKFPGLQSQLDNEAKIEDFFSCAGLGLPPETLAELEEDITSKYQDPEICANILSDAKEKLAQRCGASELLDASVDRALNFDLEKYKKLADAIRKNQNLSNDIPSIFGDCFGNSGVLSGLPNPAMDHAVEQSVEAIIDPVRRSMKRELFNLTKPILDLGRNSDNPIVTQAALVNHSPKIADMKRSNSMTNAIELCTLHSGLPSAAASSLLPGAGLPLAIASLATFPSFNEDTTFKDVVFGSNLKVNKNLQLIEDDDASPIDSVLADLGENIVIETPQESTDINPSAKITVPINGSTGETIQLELLPAETDEDGNIIYTDNYSLNLTIENVLGVKNLETISLIPKDNQLPDALVEHIQNYTIDPNSSSPPQAQYFSELILENLRNSPGGNNLTAEFTNSLKETLENEIYWSLWKTSLDYMADALSDAELLRGYELNRQDEFIGFNPFLFIPGMAAIIGLIGVTTVVGQEEANLFYGGKFLRKEMINLDMQSYGDADGIINIEKLKKIIKDNYDFSRAHDPKSEKMGMPHYAILHGLVSGLIQLFVGEVFVRGIVPVSKFPLGVLTSEEYTVEIIFRNMNEWLSTGSNEFKVIFVKIIREMFKPCNTKTILFVPDEPDEEDAGIPGTATGLEKDYRIESWEDGLRFLIRQEMMDPAKFVKNKLSSFKTRDGVGITPSNPVAAITYGKMLQVPDQTFQEEKDNTSLFNGDRIEEFKNGKLFLQYYFEVVDWEPEDENYIASVAQRDPKLRGILSEDNFVELVSQLCGIPTGFPQNYESNNALLSEEIAGDNLNFDPFDLPFKDLFKEINFGLRLCYGAIQTTQTETPGGTPIVTDQNPKITDFINNIKEFCNLKDGEDVFIVDDKPSPYAIYGEAAPAPGPEEDIINFASINKSLLIMEEQSVFKEYGVGSPETQALGQHWEVIDPLYTTILPLFSQKVQIAGAGAYEGGYPLFNSNVATLNYLSAQFRLFTSGATSGSGYAGKVMSKLSNDFFTSPAYEGIFRYAIPIPKLASMLTVHNIIIASKDKNVTKAFNLTKSQLKDLIKKTTQFVGPEMYKIPFS